MTRRIPLWIAVLVAASLAIPAAAMAEGGKSRAGKGKKKGKAHAKQVKFKHKPLSGLKRWKKCATKFRACRRKCRGNQSLSKLGSCAGKNRCWRNYRKCRRAS